MKIKKSDIAIALSFVAIAFSALAFTQTDTGQETLGLPPDGYELAKTDSLRFLYPSEDLIFILNEGNAHHDGGFWDREVYERLIASGDENPTSDTMPFIQVVSLESSGRSLEEIAIDEQGFGDEERFADIPIFKPCSDVGDCVDNFIYGYEMIGDKNVLWVYAAEKFETTTYYFEDGDKVHVFTTLFPGKNELVESMIESIR